MLVNDRASAVGDMDGRSGLVTVVIADVGGAVKVNLACLLRVFPGYVYVCFYSDIPGH